MPELPEVETTLRGIKPPIINQAISDVIIRHSRLRWPIPTHLKEKLMNQVVLNVKRRGKYLLIQFPTGTLILHLGMSGRLSILSSSSAAKKHDHVDLCFANHIVIRFTDPRRFGAILWTEEDPKEHLLLKELGPEPLTRAFNAHYLWQRARNKKVSIKAFIMDSKIVVGVGNIYATEALFQAHLHPQTPASKISLAQLEKLVFAIKIVLKQAIQKGGTTLKDFMKSDGSPGYFSVELKVYGRQGKPCPRCHTLLKSTRIAQRSTVFCPTCQK